MTGMRATESWTTRNVPPHTAVMPKSAAKARLGRDFQFANICASFAFVFLGRYNFDCKTGFIILAGFNPDWLPVEVSPPAGFILKSSNLNVKYTLQKEYNVLQLA